MIFEIGSEFWTGSTPLDSSGVKQLLPVGQMDIRYTLCGRTALELVLRDAFLEHPVKKVYLPAYCCHTMIEPFVAKGVEVVFYDVYFTDTGIDCAFREDNDCDMVFLMDYFGFRDGRTVQRAFNQRARGKRVIYDATHSVFCMGIDYSSFDYVFGSFRKWFGVNAGFCAKKNTWIHFPDLEVNRRYTQIRNAAFDQKRQYIAGKPVEKDVFLRAFSWAEEQLETDYLAYGPDKESVKILELINVDFARQKRRENANFIIERITEMNSPLVCSPYGAIGEGDCPLFVPLQVKAEHRAELRKKLIENKIYFPVHWPLSPLHHIDDISWDIYETELSFVCDQRYDKNHIIRAIETVRSILNNG